jgi:DNA modification methylase
VARPANRKAQVHATASVDATITAGDAFDVLPKLDPQSVDLLLTSPPYWGLRDYGLPMNEELLHEWRHVTDRPERPPGYAWYRAHGGVLGLEPYPEWYITHLVEFFERSRLGLAPTSSIWVNLGDTYFARWSSIRREGRQGLGADERSRRRTPSGGWRHDKQLMMLPARFAIAMQEAGWILRNDLIWSKPNVGPRPEVDRLRLSHEHFFHFVQRTPGRRPSYYYDLPAAEKGALDVVRASRGERIPGHSATFPQELIAPRILTCSPPGGMVLDPFCGSGTTLLAAISAGRNAIGIELSPSFVKLAASRVKLECQDNPSPRPPELSVLASAV